MTNAIMIMAMGTSAVATESQTQKSLVSRRLLD